MPAGPDADTGRDRRAPLRWRSPLLVAGLATGSVLLARWLPGHPGLAEDVYGRALGPILAWGAGWLWGWAPLAVGELLLLLLLLRQLFVAGRGLWRWRQGLRSTPGLVAGALLHVVRDAGWVVLLFYLLWGFHYARPPLEDRYALPAEPAPLPELARSSVERANALRDSIGAAPDVLDLAGRAEEAWRERARRDSQLGPVHRWRWAPAKPLASSPLFRRLGVAGVYCPWTGEPTYVGSLPWPALAHTLAHEKAHQRGFAPEDEANFAGLLAGLASDDPVMRYGAVLFAQRQLLSALYREDPVACAPLLAARSDSVRADLERIRRYWEEHAGPAQAVAEAMNDRYLRAQGVEGGVASYGGSLGLLLAWAAVDGPPWGETPAPPDRMEGRLVPPMLWPVDPVPLPADSLR